jgi:hypothetical protein
MCYCAEKLTVFVISLRLMERRQWCHANNLRKYNERVIEATNHNCAIIFDSDCDFGIIPTLQCNAQNSSKLNETNIYNDVNLPVAVFICDENDDVNDIVTIVQRVFTMILLMNLVTH